MVIKKTQIYSRCLHDIYFHVLQVILITFLTYGIYIHGQVREIKKEINRRPLTHSSNSSYKIALSFSLTHVLHYLYHLCTYNIYILHINITCIQIYNISFSFSLSLSFLSLIFSIYIYISFFVNFLLIIQTGNIKLPYLIIIIIFYYY